MFSRSVILNSISISLVLVMLSACGGGGDINYTIEGGNWPWPWKEFADVFAYKTITRNVAVQGHTKIWLDGKNGEVVITGQPDGNTVMISAEARVGSDTLIDAQEGLDLLDVSITDQGNEIKIQTQQPSKQNGRQYIVDYQVILPSDLAVSVYLVNGHTDISETESSIFIVMDNGSIKADIILPSDEEVTISTVNGDIDLGIPSTTSAQVFGQVGIGSINWENIEMKDVEQTSKSLQATLGDGDGLIDLTVVNGYIDIVGIDL